MLPFFDPDEPFSSWDIQGLYGAPAVFLEETESTHLYSRHHFKELVPGTLIVANSQSAGRGRHERSWVSPTNKNLYCNLIISLKNIPKQYFAQITQVTAILITQVLHQIEVNVAVKWPNDLLWHRQKIGGIISERLIHNDEYYLSLGIGLNVNSDAADFEDIGRPVTSLKLICKKPLRRSYLLQMIIKKIEEAIPILEKDGVRPWIEEWRQMENFFGEKARIVEFDKIVTGTIHSINDNGSLSFQKESGEIINVYAGDLEI